MSNPVKHVPVLCLLGMLLPFLLSADPAEIRLNGRNVVWSPGQNVLLYAAIGKSSGSSIWRLFDPATGSEDTICYGRNVLPVWSFDGAYIAYQKDAFIMVMDKDKNSESIRTPDAGIDSIAWSPDSLRLIYSGDNKISLYDIASRKNSFVAEGRKPVLCPGNSGILFTDDDFFLYWLDSRGEKQVLMSGVDDYKFTPDQSLVVVYASDPPRLVLLDWQTRATNVVSLNAACEGFGTDRDGLWLFYGVKDAGISATHLLSKKTVKVVDAGGFPGVSRDNLWFSYELPESGAVIVPYASLKDRLQSPVLYRVSLGTEKDAKEGDELEIYEEKVNPVSRQVTGYDRSSPKGKFKVISVRQDSCVCEPVGEASDLEVNDAVVVPATGVFGFVTAVLK